MTIDTRSEEGRLDPASLLARANEESRARLRVYIGAAAGVGKTFRMLEDAHDFKRQGLDVVIGLIETHGRKDTAALVQDLEQVPLRETPYRGTIVREMNLEAILARKPALCVVDELAHTNAPESKNEKRYQDVLALLDAGISVLTAVNIQHLESLNDAISTSTGVRVRETVPDWFLKRADEVVNVDVSVEALRTRLRQGKIYGVEKIDQALNNFFRKGNLLTLRELALRQVTSQHADRAQAYRDQRGMEAASIPEKVMVCMASRGSARRLLRIGWRIADKVDGSWYAVYVQTPKERLSRIDPSTHGELLDNIRFAEHLGAKVVRLESPRVADALIDFARKSGVTHVIFGQSARSRWHQMIYGSVIDRFLREVKNATVQVVPFASDADGEEAGDVLGANE
jgi:two-component system sensor histidine kinase KdpD